nr:DIE2/ALG10 family [Tanacetum cinerariifolium]
MRPPAVKSGEYTHQNGFNDIDLRYMGGMWILIGFKMKDTKAKFQSCLDIEGIPLKLWSKSTFNRIAAKWGKMLYLEKLDEGCLYSKRLCILTTGKSNILETFKIIHKRKIFSVRAKETTGWIPDFDEQEEDNSESEDEQSVGNAFTNLLLSKQARTSSEVYAVIRAHLNDFFSPEYNARLLYRNYYPFVFMGLDSIRNAIAKVSPSKPCGLLDTYYLLLDCLLKLYPVLKVDDPLLFDHWGTYIKSFFIRNDI